MRHALLLATCLLPAAAHAAAFRQFDLPGVTATCGTAIASTGVVAGVGNTPSSTPPELGSSTVFILRGHHFDTPKLDLPAGYIYPAGINRWQSVVGFDLQSTLADTYFKYHAGTVTPLSIGEPVAINDAGTILAIGQRQPPVPLSFNTIAVLQTRSGSVTQIDDGTGDMVPGGMDEAADRVVGHSFGPSGYQAWSWHQGIFKPVTLPIATLLIIPTGVDATGRIFGTYSTGTTANPVAHGFIQTTVGTMTFDAPGAASTLIQGANEKGLITGCFTNATGTHGYIAKP